MNTRPASGSAALALAMLGSLVPCVFAQPAITNLGAFSGNPWSRATAISGNGSAVAGRAGTGSGIRAFHWTRTAGLQNLGVLPGSSTSAAYAISADGSVVVGSSGATTGRAFRWTSTGGMQDIGLIPGGTFAVAWAVSADGNAIAGTSGTSAVDGRRAFLWTATGGMQNLGIFPGGDSSDGIGISADGTVVLGSGAGVGRIFLWTPTTDWKDLGLATGDSYAYGTALSADGLAVAGIAESYYGYRPVLWTAEHGMDGIGVPPMWTYWRPYAISVHGAVIGGTTDSVYLEKGRAFIWTESLGPLLLDTYLSGLGVDLSRWDLIEVTGVSYDGTALAGMGVWDGIEENFRAFLVTDLFKKADYNHDGFVDGIDYDLFMNDYETAAPGVQIRADVNFDWVVDGMDYDKFVGDFEAGR